MPNIFSISLERPLRYFSKPVSSTESDDRTEYILRSSLEAAALFFAASLILPIIMISVGKSCFLFAKHCLLPSTMLGISNLEECPLNRNIPVFVLVGGAIALLKLLQVLWRQYNSRSGPSEEEGNDAQNDSVLSGVS
jgi:hypothetical protein